MDWLKGKLKKKMNGRSPKSEKKEKPKNHIRGFEPQRTIFSILPPEIFKLVISQMDIPTLAIFARTSREYYFMLKPTLDELNRPATIEEFVVRSRSIQS
jgi:hypothetical protein